MYVIRGRNPQLLLPEVCRFLYTFGVKQDSRNGPVVRMPEPVSIVYERPQERVMTWPERDANPFFHLLESLWMLAGRRDVAYLERLVGRMASFSDDGETFHGAYGYRWRSFFQTDQLRQIILALRHNPDCRRQVLGIWDPVADLGAQSKDIPCNTQAMFTIVPPKDPDGLSRLNMMVTNRSNDAIWGALGANCVHFSMLHEYMAQMVGVEVGTYTQVTNNLHVYVDRHWSLVERMKDISDERPWSEPSTIYDQVQPVPLITQVREIDEDIKVFCEGDAIGIKNVFLRKVAAPMERAYLRFKKGGPSRVTEAREILLNDCWSCDWQIAGLEWLERRDKNHG